MEKANFSGLSFLWQITAMLFLSGSQALLAQGLDLRLDYARYNYKDQSAMLEIYYSFDAGGLMARAVNEQNAVREAVFELKILKNDSLWASDAWRTQLPGAVQQQDRVADRRVEVLRYTVNPGTYRIMLTAKDLGSEAGQEASVDVQIDPVSPDKLWMSDVELAAVIHKEKPDSSQQMFYKNQFFVIPQTDRTFSDQKPMLYYYAEIYNLQGNVPEAPYKVNTYVSDKQGNPIPEVRGRAVTKSTAMTASVEVGSLHLGKLAAGEFLLNVEVMASDQRVLVKKTKPFFMLAAPPVTALPFYEMYMAKYAAMSKDELEAELKQTSYLLSYTEKTMYQQLDNVDARRRFIADFWLRQDPSPSTSVNEAYEDYRGRIKYANENLRSFARQGWQTDRGRVYMVYGPPTDIEFFPSSENNRPYERWVYDNIDGGVEFIFVDRTGFKEYRLVTSTKIGEINDPNWVRQLAN